MLFAALAVRAAMKFHGEPLNMVKESGVSF